MTLPPPCFSVRMVLYIHTHRCIYSWSSSDHSYFFQVFGKYSTGLLAYCFIFSLNNGFLSWSLCWTAASISGNTMAIVLRSIRDIFWPLDCMPEKCPSFLVLVCCRATFAWQFFCDAIVFSFPNNTANCSL